MTGDDFGIAFEGGGVKREGRGRRCFLGKDTRANDWRG